MYAGDYYPTSEEGKELVKFAKKFIELIEKIIMS
jgi:HEPN domain-containing protein